MLPALHVTGERTLVLRLSNAVSAVIDDGVATGVIVRESELPKAWLARFGRTASDHAAQAIARRLEAGQRETQVTVAGRRVDGLSVDGLLSGVLPSGGWRPASAVEDMATRLAAPALAASGAPFGGVDADPGTPGLRAGTWGGAPGALDRESFADAGQTLRRAVLPDFGFRLPGVEEALMGTSFYVERGAQQDVGGATWAAWGDVAATRFEGDAGGLALNGDVVTGTAGLDRQWRAVLVGLARSRSSGEGGYGTGAGTIASTLTSVHPYVQVRLGERAQVWGAAGWGRGGLEITPESGAALEADLRNSMAAAGARAVLMGAGGLEIALRSDFLWTETSSDGTAALAEAVGTASRGRLMLEGVGQIQGLGGVVRPKVEGGVRYDGGDAETGQGFEVGGGLDWARGSLTLQVNGRMLIAHADESYEEWGYSGSLVYEPGADGLGLQMRVGSSGRDGGERHPEPVGAGERQRPRARGRHALRATLRRRGRLRARARSALVSLLRRRRFRPNEVRPEAQLGPDDRGRPRVRAKEECGPWAGGRDAPPGGAQVLAAGALRSERARDPGGRARSLPGRRLREHRSRGMRPCRRLRYGGVRARGPRPGARGRRRARLRRVGPRPRRAQDPECRPDARENP